MRAHSALVNQKSVLQGTEMIEEMEISVPVSRREARRISRREAILDVAAQSFLENGYAATTMNGIAAALGGSKGTLWSYFPSKEGLFAAVLDRATTVFRAQLQQILNRDDATEQTLHRFCHGFIERVTSPDAIALHRLVIGEVQRFPEVGSIFYARAAGSTRGLLADYLAEAMEAGHLRRDDPLVAAEHLTQLCLGGSHQRLMLGVLDRATPAQTKADARNAMATFMRAFGT